MIKYILKPKLRKGLSYAIKTSQLEQALLDAKIDIDISLDYWVCYIIALSDRSQVLFQEPYSKATYNDNCLKIRALPNYWDNT